MKKALISILLLGLVSCEVDYRISHTDIMMVHSKHQVGESCYYIIRYTYDNKYYYDIRYTDCSCDMWDVGDELHITKK